MRIPKEKSLYWRCELCIYVLYTNKYIHGAYLPAGSPLSYATPKVNICTCKWHSRLPICPLSLGASGPHLGSLFLFLQLLHFVFELGWDLRGYAGGWWNVQHGLENPVSAFHFRSLFLVASLIRPKANKTGGYSREYLRQCLWL